MVGARTLEVSVRSDGDNGGSRLSSNLCQQLISLPYSGMNHHIDYIRFQYGNHIVHVRFVFVFVVSGIVQTIYFSLVVIDQHGCHIQEQHRRIEILTDGQRRCSGKIFDPQLVFQIVVFCFYPPPHVIYMEKIVFCEVGVAQIREQVFGFIRFRNPDLNQSNRQGDFTV